MFIFTLIRGIFCKEMLLDKRYEALQDSVRVDEKRVLLNHVTYMTKALEVCNYLLYTYTAVTIKLNW